MKARIYFSILTCFIFSYGKAQGKFGGGNGDGYASQTFTSIVLSTNTIKNSNISSFQIYPNPAKDIISLNYGNLDNNKMIIFDIRGKIVMTLNKALQQIRISHLSPGIYYIKIGNSVGKMIKE